MYEDEYEGFEDIEDDENVEDVDDSEDFEDNDNIEDDGGDGLCAVCRRRAVDTSESSSAILCAECRQRHLKLRIPRAVTLFLAAVFAVFFVSVRALPPVLSSYRTYLTAERQMAAREFAFAYHNYCIVLRTYGDSVPIVLKAADAAMSAQNFGDLAALLNTRLDGKSLSDSEYDRAMEHSNFLGTYAGTVEALEAIFAELGAQAGDSEEAAPLLRTKLLALADRDDMDRTLVYYYLGSVSEDTETALTYLRLAAEQDPRLTYPYAQYGTALRRAGRMEEARQVYGRALTLNACDALALRGLSIVQLLEGQAGEALATIRQAYAIDPEGLYIPEALLITLCENGLREEAMGLLSQLRAGGFEVEADLQDYLDGNTGIAQYYVS